MWNNLVGKAATAFEQVAYSDDALPKYKEAVAKLKAANLALKQEL
jgi:hypothetical protein